jgi:hypothetical protein
MKENELIRSLDSISHTSSYSKYGSLVEKMHDYHSLKRLINKLKHPIKIKKLPFLEDFNNKYPIEKTTLNIQDSEFMEFVDPMFKTKNEKEIKQLIAEEEKKLCKNNSNKKINAFKNNPKPFNDYINSDPFKYKPNYDSIYKNVPSTKFYLPSKEYMQAKNNKSKINIKKGLFLTNSLYKKNNENKKSNESIGNKINESNKQKILSFINNFKKQSNKNVKLFPLISPNKKLKLIKNSRSESNLKLKEDNHALRFSKYVKRKSDAKKGNDIISYINPFNYSSSNKVKAIDFNKMKPHSLKKIFLNLNTINNPSICYYQPKYDILTSKNSIVFNSNQKPKNSKKFMIHKIWSSYDVTKDYLSIDNDKLDKKIKKNLFKK